ncbi:RNA polymerase sigma factor [Salisaeta longa]|uniref:RNA polymerase sigma factor n=1 Tax=Salisaeta longa TaxID=503170 RepID=UPI0003B3C263|nr:sigma-70 family RNA polymerase sigma factor [Salisaeta longa]
MADAASPFDPDRVRRAQDGDDRARSVLLDALQPILKGYFIKRIGKTPDVDDLIQNTLLRVHNGIEDINKPGSFKAFAMKAALFELQDYYRGRYDMKERLYDPELPLDRTTAPDDGSARVDVERAMELLSPKAQRILELREYGYKYREIAQMIDTTEAAIKMQVKRAFDKLRDALAGLLLFVLLGGA